MSQRLALASYFLCIIALSQTSEGIDWNGQKSGLFEPMHYCGKNFLKIEREWKARETPRPLVINVAVGDWVGHANFGDGIVVEIIGNGVYEVLIIEFRDGVRKKLLTAKSLIVKLPDASA